MAPLNRARSGAVGAREGQIPDFRDLPLGPRLSRAVSIAWTASHFVAQHWLAMANSAILLVVGLSVAIPAMEAAGWHQMAAPLFESFHLICHQLPYRSFFLFGHQMPMCERDLAIYGSLLVGGLIYSRYRDGCLALPWRWYLLALVPIGVDGLTQLLDLRESNWQLRLVTGIVFGIATVATAYPRLDMFANEVLD